MNVKHVENVLTTEAILMITSVYILGPGHINVTSVGDDLFGLQTLKVIREHTLVKNHTNVTLVANVSHSLVDCICTRKNMKVKKETNSINVRHVQKDFGLMQNLLYITENTQVKNHTNVRYAPNVLLNLNFSLLI